ncbi:MAG: enoyl-CoA hydratase/isomerase family protein [Chloroflexi bacterium]|nr:enoyl-CoA hydratase/isomerase family protein [Chloroflexota bacterium]
MADPKVLTERQDTTFVVTINRPDVRNCVDGETAQLLNDAADVFRDDNELAIMILTGAGDISFCSGADLKAIETLGTRPRARESGPMGVSRITDLGKPVIGAINGYCTAGGLELACWCDFRIASRNAQFGVLNRRWGVPLVDGSTQRLPRIVGTGNALYLIETGALIDAEHAMRIGLVQELVPEKQALERALVVAQALGRYPQRAMRRDRQAVLEGLTLPIDDGLAHEARVHHDTAAEPEMADWLRRYAEGDRPPPFRPPE